MDTQQEHFAVIEEASNWALRKIDFKVGEKDKNRIFCLTLMNVDQTEMGFGHTPDLTSFAAFLGK